MQKITALLILYVVSNFSAEVYGQSNSQAIDLNVRPAAGFHISTDLSQIKKRFPHFPLSVPISIPGTVPVGLTDMYQSQFSDRGLHNIIIDPDHPQNIHAAITFALNITEKDTIGGKDFLPQLRVYYIFSSDDGKTWSTPKAIDTARTSNHEMILIKRGAVWVPAIAAVRNDADTNAPYYCSLYLEQGNPGDGNFKEFRTDRKTFRDSLRNIDFPSIALSKDGSKIFMTAGIDDINKNTPQYIQFGTFTVSEDGKSLTWGGWKAGPDHGKVGAEDPLGFAFPFSTSVRVSPGGKIGVLWINRDYGTPDLSTCLSESTDDGLTWLPAPKTVLTPLGTQQAASPSGDPYVLVAFNTDLWYIGEQAQCVMAGYYYNRDTGATTPGYYIPESGSLLFWADGMTTPVLIISKENDSDLGQSILDGSWLSAWQNKTGSTEPQGLTNLNFPTVARTSDSNVFSIYFNAWQDGDIEDVSSIGQIGNGMFISYPYFSIWRTTTLDRGVTFSDPELVHGNDPTNSTEVKFDYRQIETAPWNPDAAGFMAVHTLFNVDSTAGEVPFGGNPGFDEVTWLFENANVASDGVTAVADTHLGTARNYPNPFNTHTNISLMLTKSESVSLRITDLLGREVAEMDYGILGEGSQTIGFDAVTLSSGSYPYVIMMGGMRFGGIMNIMK